MQGYLRHPSVPWVLYQSRGAGYHSFCQACRAQSLGTGADVDAFARAHAAHQASSSHLGLGDAIAAATSRLGIQPCGDCEARRYRLNQVAPRLWRR